MSHQSAGLSSVRAVDLPEFVGREYLSDWFQLDQQRVDAFADVTIDHQWIHTDVARADAEGEGTIAHGFLCLSLFTQFANSMLKVTDHKRGLNYGFDKIRFTAPVPTNARIRLRMKVAAVEPRSGGLQLRRDCALEIEGQDRPAIVADWLSLYFLN